MRALNFPLCREAPVQHEQQQAGLAAEFNAEFDALVDPQKYRRIRRAALRRFPFLVWYQVQKSRITILACTHGKANPSQLIKGEGERRIGFKSYEFRL